MANHKKSPFKHIYFANFAPMANQELLAFSPEFAEALLVPTKRLLTCFTNENLTTMFETLQLSCDSDFEEHYGHIAQYWELKTPGMLKVCHLFDDRSSTYPEHIPVYLLLLHRVINHNRRYMMGFIDVNYSLTRHESHDASCFFMSCLTGIEMRGIALPLMIENHLSFRARVCESLLLYRKRPVPSSRYIMTWLDLFCSETSEGRAVAALSKRTKVCAYKNYVEKLASPYTATGELVWIMAASLLSEMGVDVKLVIIFGDDNKQVYGSGSVMIPLCLWKGTFYGFIHNSELCAGGTARVFSV